MYHFPNEALYHDAYQCSIYVDDMKIQTVPSTVHNSQLEAAVGQNILSTAVTVLPEHPNGHRTPNEDTAKQITTQKINSKVTSKVVVDTSNFSIEERLVAAVWVHERKRTRSSMSQIKLDYRQRFGHEPPAKNTLLVWERKLFSTGSICDAPRPGRPIKREAHAAEVAASLDAAPALSVRARARALRVPRTTLRALLHDHAHSAATKRDNNAVQCGMSVGKQQITRRLKKNIARKGKGRTNGPAPPPVPAHTHRHTQRIPLCAHA